MTPKEQIEVVRRMINNAEINHLSNSYVDFNNIRLQLNKLEKMIEAVKEKEEYPIMVMLPERIEQ